MSNSLRDNDVQRNRLSTSVPGHRQGSSKNARMTVSAGTDGKSDRGALRLEQRAAMVQNVMSARTIELSPDITVANAIQRVTAASPSSATTPVKAVTPSSAAWINVIITCSSMASKSPARMTNTASSLWTSSHSEMVSTDWKSSKPSRLIWKVMPSAVR